MSDIDYNSKDKIKYQTEHFDTIDGVGVKLVLQTHADEIYLSMSKQVNHGNCVSKEINHYNIRKEDFKEIANAFALMDENKNNKMIKILTRQDIDHLNMKEGYVYDVVQTENNKVFYKGDQVPPIMYHVIKGKG